MFSKILSAERGSRPDVAGGQEFVAPAFRMLGASVYQSVPGASS